MPPPTPHRFTSAELADCAEREAKLRRRVYPGRVANRRMSRQLADRQIALMEAIAAEYRRRAEDEAAKEMLL